MRPRHIITTVVLALLPLLCSCSQLGWKIALVPVVPDESPPHAVSDQERRFAAALEFLRAGNAAAASGQLARVVADPPIEGLTDEALFRLSLLSLREEGNKGSIRALELLERLNNEFPRSIWTHQAAPLSVYLEGVKMLRNRQREVKTLKELNLSLSRDNRGMRQTLERLNNLDLELDQKIKR
ncbi:MAG: hypothetical protein M0T70_01770 [Geobacteraceae bacterium]|nr:hypothetical protein [Geobacteraceae bacterium]